MSLSGWDNRFKITIDSSVVDAELTDFPIMIRISAATGKTNFDMSPVFDEVGANSLKIAVATDADVECYVEVEKWDESGEEAILHVKVPTIASGADTVLYLYYDSSHADNIAYVGLSASAVAQNVWDSDFELVYHMNQDPNDTDVLDSTSNNKDSTPSGAAWDAGRLVDGKIGNCIRFKADSAYLPFTLTALGTQYTLEVLYKFSSASGNPMFVCRSDSNFSVLGSAMPTLGYCYASDTNEEKWVSGQSFDNTDWHYFQTVRNDTDIQFWEDLAQRGTGQTFASNDAISVNSLGALYNGSNNRVIDGWMCEVRISSTTRPAAWRKATNHAFQDTLITVADLIDYGYDFKVEMAGYGDITQKVSSFQITDNIEQYAREMTLNISDPVLYDGLDFSNITTIGEITLYTKLSNVWIQQGVFYIERPSLAHEKDSAKVNGVWGRSYTARLGAPFSGKVTKVWEEDTSFYSICEEMCDLVGITWDENLCTPADYKIYSYTYSVEYLYPIDVLVELSAIVGAMVTTDKDDNLRIIEHKYTPTNPLWTVTDNELRSLREQPYWPEFGNRIRISPIGSLVGYQIYMYFPDGQCIANDGETQRKIMIQIIDSAGLGINNEIVEWSHDGVGATFSRGAETLTQNIMVSNEFIEADAINEFQTGFIPFSILSVYKSTDTGRTENYASGATIDGRTVILADDLDFCDELIYVTYIASGCSINYVVSGTIVEDIEITAKVKGEDARGNIYIGNSCECPLELFLVSAPQAIYRGQVAHLLLYVEDSGPVNMARNVYMSNGEGPSRKGRLEWEVGVLGQVRIQYEKVKARNDVPGNSQIELSMYPQPLDTPLSGRGGIYVYLNDGNDQPVSGNKYASRVGNSKVINLSEKLTTGTELLVDYEARGAVLNRYYGDCDGNEQIVAVVQGNRREPFTVTYNMTISDLIDCEPDEGNPTAMSKTLSAPALHIRSQPGMADSKWGRWLKLFPQMKDAIGNRPLTKTMSVGVATVKFAIPQWTPVDPEEPVGAATTPGCSGDIPVFEAVVYNPPRLYNPNRNAGCSIKDIQCNTDQYCCGAGGVWGCNARQSCDSVPDPCCPYVEILPDTTDETALVTRFDDAVAAGCTCSELCFLEMSKFGTTQNYDNGNMRTTARLVIDDYGLVQGTTEYNEKHNELLNAALDACEEQCILRQGCTTGTIAYTTLGMVGGEEQTLIVENPGVNEEGYTWEVESGYGSFNTTTGISVVFTASSVTNAGCAFSPHIVLKCNGVEIDAIDIIVDTYGTENPDVVAYETWGLETDCEIITPDLAATCSVMYRERNCLGGLLTGPCWMTRALTWQDPPVTCEHCLDSVYFEISGCDGMGGGGTSINEYIAGSPYDARTAGMLAGGCCPEDLY